MVRGSRSGDGSRLGSRSGEGSRLLSRSRVKIEGGVMVGGQGLEKGSRFEGQGCGQGRGSASWGHGQGYDRWSQSRGQCRGSKSGGSMSGGQCQGEGSWSGG